MYCRQVLLDAARKVGIEGAEELLEDPTKGVDEVCFPVNSVPGAIFLSWQAHKSYLLPKGSGRTQEVFIWHFWGPTLCGMRIY